MLHYLAVAALAASSFAVTPAKVKWQADYGKALAATRNDERPLLVVIDNPTDPQASVEAELLSTEGDQGKLLKPYRLCRVDVSTDYGKKVAEAFHATQFPHTAIIDKTGKTMIYQKPGKIAADQWKTTLASYQAGTAPVAQTSYYRGDSVMSSYPTTAKPYCSACQRKAMGF